MTGNSLQAVKINIDVGEGYDDATLVPLADQVNIACGGHCGDDDSILQALELAARWGVAAGAHPSFPDRVNFGRLRMNLATSDLMDAVAGQLARISQLAQTMGVPLTHIKPHGALYHALYREADLAKAFVGILPRSLSIITMPGGMLAQAASDTGYEVQLEGYADRAYASDGQLADRNLSGAVINDPDVAARQFLALAEGRPFHCLHGTPLKFIGISTICVHSDTPAAAGILTRLRTCMKR